MAPDDLKEELTLGTQMIQRKSSKCAGGIKKGSLGTYLGSLYTRQAWGGVQLSHGEHAKR